MAQLGYGGLANTAGARDFSGKLESSVDAPRKTLLFVGFLMSLMRVF